MQHVVGIGGVFFRAKDPDALRAWYAEHLGIEDSEWGHVFGPTGSTVWSPFSHETEYFGPSGQTWMINYQVEELDAMLAQLRAGGVEVDEKTEEMEGIGRFGWAVDPEGNRFELWQPISSGDSLPPLSVG